MKSFHVVENLNINSVIIQVVHEEPLTYTSKTNSNV